MNRSWNDQERETLYLKLRGPELEGERRVLLEKLASKVSSAFEELGSCMRMLSKVLRL